MSPHDLILFNARQWPERPAILMRDRVLTYRMLGDAILSAAGRLQMLGIGPGKTVAVCIDAPHWHLIVTYALAHLGAASCSFTGPGDVEAAGVRFDLVLSRLPGPSGAANRFQLVDERWFSGEARPVGRIGFESGTSPRRIAFSSGTTGRPKAVWFDGLTWEAHVGSHQTAFSQIGWERMLVLIGLSTALGMVVSTVTLALGRALCLPRDPVDAARLAALFRIDAAAGSNGHLETFAAALISNRIQLPDMRFCYFGGSPATPALVQTILGRLTPQALLGYGSTERAIIAYGSVAELAVERGAVGRVAPWAEVEVVDENREPVPVGVDGAIRVRSEAASRPYGPDAANDPNFDADGWHYPGDKGRLDAGGILYITGRIDYLINVGGVKLAPELVEEQVRAAPGVRDAAVTQPDGQGGAVWLVAVAATGGEADLHAWCRAHVARPTFAGVIIVPEVPRTASGKIRREEVRTLALQVIASR